MIVPVPEVRELHADDQAAIARVYIDHWREHGTNPFQDAADIAAHLAETRRIVDAVTSPGDKVLDAGCAMGELLAPFADLHRYGVDLVEDYRELVEANGVKFETGEIEDLPFVGRLFDVVVATDVLEHVLDLNAAMRELLRVLRPGGVIIMRTPNAEDLAEYVNGEWDYVHLRRFDAPTFQLLCRRIFGLTDVAIGYSGHGRGQEIHCVARKPA